MTDTIDQMRQTISPIAKKYDAKQIYLFGSFARGDASVDSDIDLRLEMGRTLGLFALSGFAIDLEFALGRKVDLLTTGGLDANFLEAIRPEEVLLYDSH